MSTTESAAAGSASEAPEKPEAKLPPKPDGHLMSHQYDGIQEYDNPLPGWWKACFYGSIVFAIGYWFYYHGGGPGKSEHEEYAVARKAYDDQRAAEQAAEGAVSESTLAGRAKDAAAVARGKAVFAKYCPSCHTDNGRGLVGPNLTDDFQKHGTTRADLFKTVKGGVTGTAMIAWGETLKPDEVLDVVAFVSTLRGTNVPDGKAPEGERVGPFE